MVDVTIVAARIALAALFGALIGVEREWRHKAAGLKTNMLVAVGAAAFAMLSNTFGPDNHNPAQMAASVITGIGFIGAGVIIHRLGSVQGVTTAATLWANAAGSVAIGVGQFWIAAFVFAAILFVQFLVRSFERRIAKAGARYVSHIIELSVTCDPATVHEVAEAWQKFAARADVAPIHRSLKRRPADVVWSVAYRSLPQEVDLTPLEAQLDALAGVHQVEVRVVGPEEE